MHLLTGVSVEELTAWFEGHPLAHPDTGLPDRCWTEIPQEWGQAGRRRAAEIAAATGTYDALTAMRYVAGHRYGVELVMEDRALWMPKPEVVG
ncbi:hypothetical protein AWB98_06655 [Mycolicibacterium conceptionense]|nr:hypothetical protein AWB98_06655 [Mycolicibacterium conceptionense]